MIQMYKSHVTPMRRLLCVFSSQQLNGKSYSQVTKNLNTEICNKKSDKLKKKAIKLIFGPKKYLELTSKEKKIVDLYQDSINQMSCGCVVLPNTNADLEQRLYEQSIEERALKKQFSKE